MTEAFDDQTDPDRPAPVDPVDEATVISDRRGAVATPIGPPDDATVISARRAAESGPLPADDPAQTVPMDHEPPGPRRAQRADDEAEADADDDDDVDFAESFDDDGSTVVARRESRRRQQRAEAARLTDEDEFDLEGSTARASRSRSARGRGLPATLAADVPAPLGRVARVPGTAPAASPARPGPVVVPRATPVGHAPQDLVDTAADESARRSRSRRIAAMVVVAGSLLALGAAAALTVLVLAT